ncbi:NifU-like N terminal domain-containing protein [Pavlovales sp. CCMP2436]|nr:NifU-like N terminal domain-containing protein [Pavlovales sp. CCMP2436]
MLALSLRRLALARTPVVRMPAATRAYHQNVIEHYENPRNVGKMDKDDPDVGTGIVGAPACGDVMKLQIRVNEDGTVREAVFKTFGCGSAIASSSFATEASLP